MLLLKHFSVDLKWTINPWGNLYICFFYFPPHWIVELNLPLDVVWNPVLLHTTWNITEHRGVPIFIWTRWTSHVHHSWFALQETERTHTRSPTNHTSCPLFWHYLVTILTTRAICSIILRTVHIECGSSWLFHTDAKNGIFNSGLALKIIKATACLHP